MAKDKSSAAGPAISASAAMASKDKRSAPASAKDKESTPAAMEATMADTTPAAKGAPAAAAANAIEIPSSPDYVEGSAKGSSRKKAPKRSAPPLVLDDEIQMWTPREKRIHEEDCQILDGDLLAAAEMTPAAAAGDDDIEIVAERGKVACRDYPHPRPICAKNPFNTTPHGLYCDKCFCFVCDVPAPCVSWMGTGGHCHASDKVKKWKAMRLLRQKQKQLK